MIRLIEGERGLWERFQRDHAAQASLASRDIAAEALLLPRWRRARDLGVAAEGPAHPLGVSDQDLAARRDAALDEIGDGAAVIEALEAEVTPRGLLAVVTDADGVIVRARGGGAFPDVVRSTRLVEGARWDEGARGTNAIGTAIAEAQPVAVVGRAHFETVNHGLFCYAAPVAGPFGERAAVIDVTGPLALDQPEIGAAVGRASAALEDIVRAHAYARAGAQSVRFVERLVERAAGPTLLLESPGIVRALNTAALAELDGSSVRTVDGIFGMGWAELLREAVHGPAVFETRRRRFRVEFQPIAEAGGRTLALLCFLTAETRSPCHSAVRAPGASPLPSPFDAIVASDPRVVAAKRTAAHLATSELPVLLLAETGTGKELFAQAIHRTSRRAAGALVALNCGAFTGTLLESELFGYAPGAFTGASRGGSAGRLAAAHGGTLFLDEVAELTPAAQAALLRFLEDGSYSRVGEATLRKADVRVVCATCGDLPKLVERGAFRSDLFFRIQGGCIRITPLRERVDRLELARALLRWAADHEKRAHLPEFDPSAEAWILDHSWPGNVRELKTSIVHALVMASGSIVGAEHFPEPLLAARPLGPSQPDRHDAPSRRQALRAMAEDAVTRAGGNMSEAARLLGVARSTLYRMLDSSR